MAPDTGLDDFSPWKESLFMVPFPSMGEKHLMGFRISGDKWLVVHERLPETR